jgi:hypothetical protein
VLQWGHIQAVNFLVPDIRTYQIDCTFIFMVEPCILRSIDCLLPTNALNVNFI